MNDGFTGMILMRLIASSSVPSAFGLAGLSKPTWLSLICRKVMPAGSAAIAEPTRPSERGTPPGPGHAFQHLAAAEAGLRVNRAVIVVVMRAHRRLHGARDWASGT